MRLKELIARSGGVITAIALLGSMMSMAGAARDGTYTCSLCGADIPYGQYGNDSGNATYQQYYSVGDIDDLTNGNNFYFKNNEINYLVNDQLGHSRTKAISSCRVYVAALRYNRDITNL